MSEDVVALRDEQIAGAKPLLEEVLRAGRIVAQLATLEDARWLCRDDLERLPDLYKRLVDPARSIRLSSARDFGSYGKQLKKN